MSRQKPQNKKRKIAKISFEKEPWYAAAAARMSAVRTGSSVQQVASPPLSPVSKYAR